MINKFDNMSGKELYEKMWSDFSFDILDAVIEKNNNSCRFVGDQDKEQILIKAFDIQEDNIKG